MIHESRYWKEDLRRRGESLLHRCKNQRRWPEASVAKVEQDAMIGCYSIRKLMDSGKLTTRFEEKEILIPYHPFRGGALPDTMNSHRLDDHYDLQSCNDTQVAIRDLCNLLIHSFSFDILFEEDEKTLSAIMFTSDRTRGEKLYTILVTTLANLFIETANNYPNAIHSFRDENGDWHHHRE